MSEDSLIRVDESLARVRALNRTSARIDGVSVVCFFAAAVVAFMLLGELWPPRALSRLPPAPVGHVQ